MVFLAYFIYFTDKDVIKYDIIFSMVIANILGIFILFYFLWSKLKEDYQYERIFNLAFTTLLGFGIGAITSRYILQNYWFWLDLLGILLGFIVGIKRQKIKFFESFEGLVIGLLPWTSLIFLSDSIKNFSLSSFLAFWVTLICVVIFFFIASHYRSFTWYKSGRVGFAGTLTALLFFIFRLIATIFFKNVISLAGKLDIYISASVVLILFLLLYSLSRDIE